MRIIVTGAAGFIGSHFVDFLLKSDISLQPDLEVIAFDALKYSGHLQNLRESLDDPRVKFVKGDILDREILEEIIHTNDYLVNFAAESHVDRSISSSVAFTETNVLGVNTLLEVGIKKRIRRFLQVSTDEVYGSVSQGSSDEHSKLDPNSPYAASKAAADLLVKSFFVTHKLDVVITRSSNNYGPRQYPEKLIPVVISNASQNIKIPIYGSGVNIRDWIHVNDNCSGILAALLKGKSGEIYNLGGSNEITNLDLTKLILQKMNINSDLIEHVVDRKGHDLRYSVNSEKAHRELGFLPKKDFLAGIETTIKWYKDNPDYFK